MLQKIAYTQYVKKWNDIRRRKNTKVVRTNNSLLDLRRVRFMFPYFYLSKGSEIHGISFTLLSNPNITIKKKKTLNFRPMYPLILKLSDLSENKETKHCVFM